MEVDLFCIFSFINFLAKACAKLSLEERTVQLFGYYFRCEQRLKHEHSTAAINCTGYSEVDQVLMEHQHVFSTDEDKLGECLLEPCQINTGDALSIKQRPHCLPLSKQHLVEEQIKETKRL